MAKVQMSKYGVAQTKSTFKIRGVVFGTKGKNFYTDDGKKRSVSFGVNINENKPIYCRLQGFTKDKVYYSNKSETIAVNWANRMKAPKAGFDIIGIRVGLEVDDNGKNVIKNMTEYDAAQYLSQELHDGASVVVIGDIETYVANDGTTKRNYVPKQIYLESEEIDFNNSDFKEKAIFYQTLIYTDMEKETDENGNTTGRVLMHGYDVNYGNVCKIEYVLTGKPLEKSGVIRKKMKPFYSFDVSGYIDIVVDATETDGGEDDWGIPNELGKKRINSPVRIEFVVDHADASSIDEEAYSEKTVMNAIRQINSDKEARKNFGEKPEVGVNVNANDWDNDDDDAGDEPW